MSSRAATTLPRCSSIASCVQVLLVQLQHHAKTYHSALKPGLATPNTMCMDPWEHAHVHKIPKLRALLHCNTQVLLDTHKPKHKLLLLEACGLVIYLRKTKKTMFQQYCF